MRLSEERHHEHDGQTYVIRDVWDDADRFIRCEYAVEVNGKLSWTPCREGVLFSEIRPCYPALTKKNWAV
jgi:hypothetical protein